MTVIMGAVSGMVAVSTVMHRRVLRGMTRLFGSGAERNTPKSAAHKRKRDKDDQELPNALSHGHETTSCVQQANAPADSLSSIVIQKAHRKTSEPRGAETHPKHQ